MFCKSGNAPFKFRGNSHAGEKVSQGDAPASSKEDDFPGNSTSKAAGQSSSTFPGVSVSRTPERYTFVK